jgi:hypothetical protein
VKVAAGGGKAFEIQTGDEENDTAVPNFTGVIIHNHKCNAYFDEDGTGNTPPLCTSIDGKTGIEAATGEWKACNGCPFNEYGTSKKGRGKACKNMHRLYIMTEGSPIPLVLSLPPTSLKAFQNYRLSSLASRKLKPYEVVTEFSLTSEQSSTGQKYSVVKFKLLGKLAGENAAAAAFFAQSFHNAVDVTGDDYNRSDSPEQKADDDGAK